MTSSGLSISNPDRRLSVTLYDMATGGTIIHNYKTTQEHALPRAGDLLRVSPAGIRPGVKAPTVWRVDTVIMSLSHMHLDGPFMADLLCYPCPGPFWPEGTPEMKGPGSWAYSPHEEETCAIPDIWPATAHTCEATVTGVIRTAQGAVLPSCAICGQNAGEYSDTVDWEPARL